jgi:hypothetical protein
MAALGAAMAALAVSAAACDESPTNPSSTVVFTAQLSPVNEVPPVTNAEASGSGNVTITFAVNRDNGAITSATAAFLVNLTGFPSNTPLTMAHIHIGTVGNVGNIVVDTGLVQGEVALANGSGSFAKSGISVTPALAQDIIDNPAGYYFNVHSVLNSGGMVRGQLVRQ